jgi:hypothetical protein
MKRSLLLAAAAALAGCAVLEPAPPSAPPVAAAEIPLHVFEAEHVRMQLMPAACADARSLLLAAGAGAEYASRWRAIRSTWRGRDGSWRDFAGCWLELSAEEAGAPGEVLVLVFEDNTRYVVLKSDFLRAGRGGA